MKWIPLPANLVGFRKGGKTGVHVAASCAWACCKDHFTRNLYNFAQVAALSAFTVALLQEMTSRCFHIAVP